MKHPIIFFLIALLAGCQEQVTAPDIVGGWTKQLIIQGDRKDAAPRWTVTFDLGEDGNFRWCSVSHQEEWLEHVETGETTTRVRQREIELVGTWSFDGNALVLVPTTPPTGEALGTARINLGYDAATGRATAACELRDGRLHLAIDQAPQRRFVFVRVGAIKDVAE